MRYCIVILVLAGTGVTADTEIYRCVLDDGTFAFQEKPCPEPAARTGDDDESRDSPSGSEIPAARDDVFDFVNPYDEPEDPPTQPEATQPEGTLPEPVSQDRTECEKMTRDAIDAIDLEMRQSPYTKEQGQEYMTELRSLTQQLRACKKL